MEGKKLGRVTAGLFLTALGVFVLASLATHNPYEGPFPDAPALEGSGNACGPAGAYVSSYALAVLGWTSYVISGLLAATGLVLTLRLRMPGLARRAVGLPLVGVFLLLALSDLVGPNAGGALGVMLSSDLRGAAGPIGTFILMLLCGTVGLFLVCGAEMAILGGLLRGGAVGVCRSLAAAAAGAGWAWGALTGRAAAALRAKQDPAPAYGMDEGEMQAEADVAFYGEGEDMSGLEPEPDAPAEPEPEPELEVFMHGVRNPDYAVEEDEQDVELELSSGREPLSRDDYHLPDLDLISPLTLSEMGETEDEVRQKGKILQRTLGEFNINAQVVRVSRGPVITMYELSLAPGTKVSRVESLSDDLAIALKAPNVRIVAPLPGRNTIGIEVPNTERELVGIREMMDVTSGRHEKLQIPLFIGKDTSGHPLLLDLAACPHLLIAGSTGSGKSVAMTSMITSILMTRRPDEVQLLLIDPKSVEFTEFAHLPHLICPVVKDMKKAASVLKWACKKMDERYSLLSSMGVRDLMAYNSLGEEGIRRRLDTDEDVDFSDIPRYMSHIVIIVDELSELMMVAPKEVESCVIRLSQKARAVGVHLICATQRPSADVITGLIKANLPARIAFQVASKVESRIILDRNGAELLLGRGDMLLLPPGTSRLVRAQGSFIPDDDVRQLVSYLETQGPPLFRADLRDYHARQEDGASSDDLYQDAVRIILESQRGSVSLLQRRLAVGYSRAARLIDMMAEAGLVGPHRGSQARQVYMTLEEWDAARAEA